MLLRPCRAVSCRAVHHAASGDHVPSCVSCRDVNMHHLGLPSLIIENAAMRAFALRHMCCSSVDAASFGPSDASAEIVRLHAGQTLSSTFSSRTTIQPRWVWAHTLLPRFRYSVCSGDVSCAACFRSLHSAIKYKNGLITSCCGRR